MILEFHEACGLGIGSPWAPAIRNGELRCALLEEEVREFREAVEAGDLVAAVDAIADIQVCALGAAVEFGVDMEAVDNEVHKTNMAKAAGPKREDGKQLKPPGWKAPDIETVLAKQREQHRWL